MADDAASRTEPKDDWSWVEDDGTDWVPPVVDLTRPSVARMYDYFIGGKDNFAIDRAAAEQVVQVIPGALQIAQANRAFLIRIVREMAEAGIDQFLDLGAGIPTSPNVHETARTVRPRASVVYVDNDPVVLAHHRAAIFGDPGLVTVPHDLREPSAVLDDAAVRGALDFDRPIGLLMIAVLHFVDLSLAPTVVSRYVRDLPEGSRVAITAISRDGMDPVAAQAAEAVYSGSSAAVIPRTQAQIEQLFDGLDLLGGTVEVIHRSDSGGSILGGLGVK